jgi:putative DNA primase/helicase
MTSDPTHKAHANGDAAHDATDLDHHKFHATFFKNMSATSKTTKLETLPELRDLILKTSGPTKMKMPWLKLATFGNVKSEVGCLRHDANVSSIEGIELDYDDLVMSFEEAIEIVTRMKVRTLLYTTPSYTAAEPKWRLLIPLSKPETRLEMRAKYVARVNGYFGNIFAEESFKLSHSYFYGKANDNPAPDHQAIIIDGEFLDLRDALYKYEARGAIADSNASRTNTTGNNEPLPDCLMQLLKTTPGGGLSNDPADLPDPLTHAEAEAALSVLDGSNCGRDRWFKIGCGLYKNFGDKEGRAIWDEWSMSKIWEGWSSTKPNARLIDQQWRSIVRGKGYGYNIGTLIYHANVADPRWRSRIEEEPALVEEPAQANRHPVEEPAQGDHHVEEPAHVEPVVTDGHPEQPHEEHPRDPDETKTEPKPSAKPKPQHSTPRRNGVVRVCAKDIIVKPKQWLWEGHLLRGAQELLTGLPGLGKSQVQIHYVACVTAGLPWPNGEKGMPPANVIMLTAEDTLDQEVVPRLIAAGADLSRVHILKCIRSDGKDRQFLLGEDLKLLEGEIAELGDVALITIDPITAYMGKIDSHKTTDVRAQLGPLKDFAERMNVAVSTITHPAKSTSQKAIDQFIGSQAFIAAGRIGHVCIEEVTGEENEKTGRILYTNAKNNPHTKMPTLAFRIAEFIGQDPNTRNTIAAPHVVWEKDAVNITADEAVRAASGTSGGKKSDGQKQAQEFLKEILSKGVPVLVKVILSAGSAHGFSKQQLKLAREKLGKVAVVQVREGWTWQWMM